MSGYLDYIISNLRFKTMSEADRFLKAHYETVFKIHDHRADYERTKIPPSVTRRHAGMSAGGYDVTEVLLKMYVDHHIKKITDMSFLEYCQIPRPKLRHLNRRCVELNNVLLKQDEERRKAEGEYYNQLLSGKGKPPRVDPTGSIPMM